MISDLVALTWQLLYFVCLQEPEGRADLGCEEHGWTLSELCKYYCRREIVNAGVVRLCVRDDIDQSGFQYVAAFDFVRRKKKGGVCVRPYSEFTKGVIDLSVVISTE